MPCDRCMYATQLRGLHAGISENMRHTEGINLANRCRIARFRTSGHQGMHLQSYIYHHVDAMKWR